jgi:hypothetical protein
LTNHRSINFARNPTDNFAPRHKSGDPAGRAAPGRVAGA